MDQTKPLFGLATAFPEDSDQLPQIVYFQPPKKKVYQSRWLLLWQDESEIGISIMEQAKSNEMTLSDYRVRDYLLATIGIGNMVMVNQREIGRELGLDKSTIFRSIKRLESFGILMRGTKNGKACTFMISPAFCFSGNLKNGIKARKDIIDNYKAKIIKFNNNIKK